MSQPSLSDWLNRIVPAVAAANKSVKPKLDSGDVLIVLDPHDLSQYCRLPSEMLFEVSATIRDTCAKTSTAGTHSDSPGSTTIGLEFTGSTQGEARPTHCLTDVQHLLVVDQDVQSTFTGFPQLCHFFGPSLRNGLLVETHAATSMNSVGQGLGHDIQTAGALKLAQESDGLLPEHVVKREATGYDIEPLQTISATVGVESEYERRAWIDAYNSFFRMLVGFRVRLDTSKSKVDLPLTERVEKIVQVADYLQAVSVINPVLSEKLIAWSTNGGLWRAIARSPQRWLRIAFILRVQIIYSEALVHIIGEARPSHLDFVRSALPESVSNTIQRKMQELIVKWMRFKIELYELVPRHDITNTPSSRKAIDPAEDHVYNIFHRWIARHLTHIDSHVQGKGQGQCPAYTVCGFTVGECLSPAGLVRTLQQGAVVDTAYMSAQSVKSTARLKPRECKTIALHLEKLKRRVSIYNEAMKSNLKLSADQCAELSYLTCIDIRPEDMPWITIDEACSDDETDVDANEDSEGSQQDPSEDDSDDALEGDDDDYDEADAPENSEDQMQEGTDSSDEDGYGSADCH